MSTSSGSSSSFWISAQPLKVPDFDILSFTFDGDVSYDENKPIFVDARDSTKNITAATARHIVRRLCKGWKEIGLQQGDCVTISSANHVSLDKIKLYIAVKQLTTFWGRQILYPLIWLGIIGAGGVVAGANPALTVSELKHHLNVTATKYLVIQAPYSGNIVKATTACGITLQSVFVFDGKSDPQLYGHHREDGETDPNGFNKFGVLLEHGQQQWLIHSDTTRPAIHATTSGTTGLPKAAVLPHKYIVSQALTLEEQYRARAAQVSQLVSLPIFHCFASNTAMILPLRLGITTYILPRFYRDEFIDAVFDFSITDAPVVPPIISMLVQYGDQLKHKLHSLRRLICAGSKMAPCVQDAFYQYLHEDCRISQCWGTTETGWLTLMPDMELDRSGSVGQLLANVKLKLVSEDGQPITKEGIYGEASVMSSAMMLGYRNNPAANHTAFDSEHCYRTGDRAYYQDGKVFITGRIKDIMKVKGWQVSPEELEEKIVSHPKVVDCAVAGVTSVDHAGLEETHPRAYVVRAKGSHIDDDDICAWTSSQTVGYKRLTGGVVFVDQIPRNPAGKILRRLLLENQ
ncbi:hypothetical protein LTR05_003349 [Lithohypha guttulata]|uniref:Luciferase n=1 Tax=Lithohypha guttulata TaxID=1690604 RepID=A0AAN7Y8Z3_9EURO|nr:hypothetical protein LTR05_003349 [Lithohypha guttulata]